MSREKQIEEIYEVLTRDCDTFCVECKFDRLDLCVPHHKAEQLYNAGYRKQSENTVEVVRCKDCKFNVANQEKDVLDITDYSGDDIVCSYFMTDGLEPTDFCSYGAKMKGGAE